MDLNTEEGGKSGRGRAAAHAHAHVQIEWGRRVCRGLSSTLGVARCSRSAGCVLCALWAVSAAVLRGGVPFRGKHIICRRAGGGTYT